MITLRRSAERGHADHGWLNTKHTFSFGRYYDPKHMGFRALRVINEDIVAPGRGFGEHPHANMEIISYVLSGTLAHKDSLGSVKTLVPGEVQRMSAGTGIEHSEFNPSPAEPAHFLQIWLLPERQNTHASYEQKAFALEGRTNRWQLLASPDGAGGSVRIGQDVRLFTTCLDSGASVTLDLDAARYAWVQVARGSITLNGVELRQGDGAAISAENRLTLAALSPSEFLVFDLN